MVLPLRNCKITWQAKTEAIASVKVIIIFYVEDSQDRMRCDSSPTIIEAAFLATKRTNIKLFKRVSMST